MATYCVSPAGKDGNPGTGAQPWQTLDKAATTAVAGDTVIFRDGTYDIGPGQASWNGGESGNVVTFRAQNSRRAIWRKSAHDGACLDLKSCSYITFEGVVIDGDFTANGWNAWRCVHLENSHHITFSDCEVKDMSCRCFWITDDTHDIVIENCDVHPDNYECGENDDGVLARGDSISTITIKGCTFCNIDHVGIYLESAEDFLIEDCTVHTTHSHLVQFGTPGDGHGWTISGTIQGCTLHGSERYGPDDPEHHNGIYITSPDVQAVTVLRNRLCDIDGSGIHVGNGVVGPIELCHNTICGANRQGDPDKACLFLYSSVSPAVRIKNNILYSTGPSGLVMRVAGDINANLDADHNLCFSDTGATQAIRRNGVTYDTYADYQAAGYEPHSVLDRDPEFADKDNADFKLQAGSPAIDAGADLGYSHRGAAPDIGAHEYQPGCLPSVFSIHHRIRQA